MEVCFGFYDHDNDNMWLLCLQEATGTPADMSLGLLMVCPLARPKF